MKNDNPCGRTTMISRKELLFRLCIPKVSWQHHVEKHSTVPSNLYYTTAKKEVIDGITYQPGVYVEWLQTAQLLMNKFRDDQLIHTYRRLKMLGFTEDLMVADPSKGVIRVMGTDVSKWLDATKSEKTGKAGIPQYVKNGEPFGIQSLSVSGLIVTDESDLSQEQLSINRCIIPKGWEPIMQDKPKGKAKKVDNTLAKEQIEKANKLSLSLSEDTLTYESTIDMDSIDFNDPEAVGTAQRKAKLITETVKAEKERVSLAKISNSVVDIDDMEKLLEGVTKALRTTMDQSVPKVTSTVKGLIITALVMDDPTLQKKLNTKVSDDVISEQIRGVFNKSLKELSDLLESFAKSVSEE